MELADAKSIESADAMEAVFERFRTFEVSATKATKEEERQHLLGVIEAGFGDLDIFNSLVQGLFESLRQEHASQVEQSSLSTRTSRSKSGIGMVRAPPKVMPAR